MASLEQRWKAERERHEQQLAPYRYFAARGLRRSATVTPPKLRYWSYAPVRAWVMALAALGLAGFLGWQALRGQDTDPARAIGVTLLIVLLATGRVTVSQHGLSFDIAGPRRVSCFGFIPLSVVLDVVVGATPAGWPHPGTASSWFPGSHAVRVLYLGSDGAKAARTAWVRDPERLGTALLGRPMRYGED
ncbi:hypothetical protein BH20ACT5_BH20ACT5_09330 [soil metagenome]